jgi:aminoacrylate hydrolase
MTLAAENPAQVTALALSGGWLHADRYIEQAFALRLQVLRQIGVSAYDRLGRFLTYPPEWLAETGDFGPQDEPSPQEAARLRQVWEERIAALLAYDGRGLAPRLTCPALVLGAVDDALIPHAHQQATAAAIPGARLVSLPGGGHFFGSVICSPLRATPFATTQLSRDEVEEDPAATGHEVSAR